MSCQRTCTVGLTGGLASGKSTVARRLLEIGAAVLDADAVVHGLYRHGEAGAQVVAELFGAEVLDPAGNVDRECLGHRVLGDPPALARLNQAVHPLVRARIRDWLAQSPRTVAVVEAALLLETGSYRNYDLLAVVWCKPEQQLARAVKRGIAEDRARQLLAAQMPIADKRRRAEVLIDNSGPPELLVGEVDRAWAEICELCRGVRARQSSPATPSDSRR